MLDLSAFAIALVIGWSLLFRRWPSAAGWRARAVVLALWCGWALVAALLVIASGVGWPMIAAGTATGFAGHAMLISWAQQGKRA